MDDVTRQFIKEHLYEDVHDLALRKTPAGVDKTLALCQIKARQHLSSKVPSWSDNPELLFPPHRSIEQCSSETTARYKADLLQGNTLVDLTGGLGIDSFFVSQNFQQAVYVEQSLELCQLARHNFEVLRRPITVCHATAEAYLESCPPVDAFFLDPSRRDQHGRKMVSISDCTPDVVALQDLLLQKASRVMVKLSPMLDISKALGELDHVKEVHVVAVANECKELLLVMEPAFKGQPSCTCVNLNSCQPAVTFMMGGPRASKASVDGPMRYLYEPNAALMKAGCFGVLEDRFQVRSLHPNSHLFTSDLLLMDFPGRVFEVEDWMPYNKRIKQTLLQGVDNANIAVRNFPMSVDDLRKSLKINDGGDVYLFATTIVNKGKGMIRVRRIGVRSQNF